MFGPMTLKHRGHTVLKKVCENNDVLLTRDFVYRLVLDVLEFRCLSLSK